jgi:hypothetical protein
MKIDNEQLRRIAMSAFLDVHTNEMKMARSLKQLKFEIKQPY